MYDPCKDCERFDPSLSEADDDGVCCDYTFWLERVCPEYYNKLYEHENDILDELENHVEGIFPDPEDRYLLDHAFSGTSEFISINAKRETWKKHLLRMVMFYYIGPWRTI